MMGGAKGRGENESQDSDPRPSDYAYTLYWTRLTMDWDPVRRSEIASSVEAVVSEPSFRPNESYRVYSVPDLDGSAHSGASLLALMQVLTAFERIESQGDSDD